MAETRKLIKASRELKEEIARKLNVTTRTVDAALAYDTKSPTARLIRSYALEKPRDFDPFGQTGLPPLATI